ncbi:unnamed protein product [Heterosigma akashiwo]
MVSSDLLAVLACLKSGRGMTRLVSEIAQEVDERHSFVYIPGHQGHEGNEVADQLAKEAANAGIEVEVDVPRAFTRRLAKEQTWRVWAQQWRDLEHGSGMGMGEDKATSNRLSGRGERRGAIGCFNCCRDIATWRGICTARGSETGRSATTVRGGRKRTWSIICFTAQGGGRSSKR